MSELQSAFTCPECGHTETVTINACQWFLRLQGLRHAFEAKARQLLRLPLLRNRAIPADPGRRCPSVPFTLSGKPGVTPDSDERQRIDKWLFFARVVKSRSLAAKLANGGRIRVNRNKIDQASHNVKIGDVLTISLDRRILVYRVLQPGTRRGPAPEARLLYEDLSPPPPEKAAAGEAQAGVPRREPGSGRPTKKERRLLDKHRRE